MDSSGRRWGWATLSVRESQGLDLGQRHHRKGYLAHCESQRKVAGIQRLAPHDCRRSCARLCHAAGGELEQIQFLLGHVSVEKTERYLGCKQRLRQAVNDKIGLEP
jgi:integrase